MKNKFRYLRHTADVSFFAYGNTEKECFKNSANAMVNLMFDFPLIKLENKKNIKNIIINEKASNKDDLLWFFLQKIISTIYIKSIVITNIKNIKISNKNNVFSITSELSFLKTKNQKYFLMDVKAVTPHQLTIKKINNQYRSHVVLDI